MRARKQALEAFYEIFESVGIEDWDYRMKHNSNQNRDLNEYIWDLDVSIAYSKMTCLIT